MRCKYVKLAILLQILIIADNNKPIRIAQNMVERHVKKARGAGLCDL